MNKCYSLLFVPHPYPVDYASRVQVSDATEDLIEQIRYPLMVQVHVDHLAQAGIHQLHYQIPEALDKIYLYPLKQ